jgi:CBS domain-containing protein
MNGKLYAGDLMTRQVRCVTAQSELSAAMLIMDEGGYDQVPVLEGDRPVKLLTERDARLALRDGKANRPVGELASPLPCLLTPEAPLSEVVEALQDRESLLILDEQGKLAGIITYWDVLQVSRPHLLVAEVELLLRRVVADAYRERYGPDWWDNVDEDIRRRAAEEHQREGRGAGDNSPEHMLGHTSFYSLIEAFRQIRPEVRDQQIQEFHKVRVWRNKVAHLYLLSEQELARLVKETLAMRDFLEPPASPACPA